jgi:hypothetical protein
VSDPEAPEYLPSIAQILKRAGALERVEGLDLQVVSRLPVFHGRAWKRAISEFLRWSGTTPDVWGHSSVFQLLLGHGPAGARALFAAYRHDRLERAETFEEADTQLEAVRTVVSMAAYWIHAIPWDLRDVPRLTEEEFRSGRRPGNGIPASLERAPRQRAGARPTDTIDRFSPEESEAGSRSSARPSSAVPVFPSDRPLPNLWKRPRRTDL